MGKENFEHVYPVIEAIFNSRPDAVIQTAEAAAEAAVLLELMDAYEEPVLPFCYITEKQIDDQDNHMKNKYGFVVWSDQVACTDETCARLARDNPELYVGYSEDEMRRVAMSDNDDELTDIKTELENIPVNGVLVSGDVEKWSGVRPAFAVLKNLGGIFEGLKGDQVTLYISEGEFRAEVAHHDGTNDFVFHTFVDGYDPEDFTFEDLMAKGPKYRAYVKSLVPALKKYFGWKV